MTEDRNFILINNSYNGIGRIMLSFKEYSDIISEEGAPVTSVSGGGVQNPEGPKMSKEPLKRKKKKLEDMVSEINSTIGHDISYVSKWDGTMDYKGQKVYTHTTMDNKYELSLTGYDGVVGKSFPHGSKKTSWMITDKETGKAIRTTYSTLPKAKKAIADIYNGAK